MPRAHLLLPLALLVAACAPPEPAAAPAPAASSPQVAPATATPTPSAAPAVTAPAAEFDPIAEAGTVEGVTKLCDEHLARASALLGEIRALEGAAPDKLDFAGTVGRIDRVALEVASASEVPYLMGVAHPDAKVREAAKGCEPKADTFQTSLFLDPHVAAVLKAYAAKNEKLDGPRARLLADTLRDFHRNGLDLAPADQQRLRDLNERITKLGQEFSSNIASSTSYVDVKPASLEGLSKEYLAAHAPGADGRVRISTDYPDYFPFITYATDRKAALDLYVLFTNRGGDANVKVLDALLSARGEKAKLLGYPSWADYAIEPRMARTTNEVRAFLGKVRDALAPTAKAELAELVAEHVRLGGKKSDTLYPPDRYYLEDRVRERKYKLDSQKLAEYFEVGAVVKGLMETTQRMYGLEYKQVDAHAWHPDVTAYEVWSGGERIGKFYFDLYSRPDKYKHAAMFGVRTAARLPDGRWQTPMAALECNFPKPGAQPALMGHDEVVTFFHEFGHVLHHLLTRSELASYAGTNTVRDFVEAPSQMFEEWAWSREVLDLFAKHYKTGEKIPDDLYQAMQKSRTFGRALSTQRQVFLATLDFEYHARAPGFDSTRVLEEVQTKTDAFAYVKGTHFQTSFGHLVGYDAGYYGYQWALAISRDVLTRFRKEGLMNAATAKDWRDLVLARGGGVDERRLVHDFLSRDLSYDAYIAYLQGRE